MQRIGEIMRIRGRDVFVPHVSLEELRPIINLTNGVPVFDKTSFPQKAEYELFPDFPFQPTLFYLDTILFLAPPEERELQNQTTLAVHGFSSPQFWRQVAHPHKQIEEILNELHKMSVGIDVILSCNPGHYQLPLLDGKNRHTYINSDVHSFNGFVKGPQGLYTTVTPNPQDPQRKIFYKGESA